MRGGAGNRPAFPLISLAPLDSFPQGKPKRWARPGGRAPHHRGSASCRRAADSRPYLRYPAHGAEPVGSLSEGASCVVWRAGVVAPHKKAWYCGRVWEAAPHTNEVPCRDVHRQSPLPWKNHPPAAVPPGDGNGACAVSREARSCPVRPTRGSADGGRSDPPASPHRALALRGPPVFIASARAE